MRIVAVTSGVNRASWVFGVLELLALAFLALAVAAAVAWLIAPARRSAIGARVRQRSPAAWWAAFAVAAVCTGGSLWLSEVCDLRPCKLCWFQRICMYPLTAVTAVAAIRRDRDARWYALPLAVVGAGLSTYHYLVEWFPSLEAGSGCDALNPCSLVWFRRFGFVSIPFMALTGFVTVAVLVCVAALRPVAAERR